MIPAMAAKPGTAVTLADFTSPDLIVSPLSSREVPGVLEELSNALTRKRLVPEMLPFYRAALNREMMTSTDGEVGMAFPHARLPGLQELSFAVGRSEQPLRWGGNAECSVRLVFLLAVPAEDTARYLLLISGFARLAKERRLAEELLSARDAIGILSVLRQISLRQAGFPAKAGS